MSIFIKRKQNSGNVREDYIQLIRGETCMSGNKMVAETALCFPGHQTLDPIRPPLKISNLLYSMSLSP